MELYLFLAVPILLILNVIVAITEKPYVALTHCCGIIVIASLCLGLGALPIQALLLFVVVHTQIPRRRQAIFIALSLLVTVVAYPLSWWLATNSGHESSERFELMRLIRARMAPIAT